MKLTEMVYSGETAGDMARCTCGKWTRSHWKPKEPKPKNGSGWQYTYACSATCAPAARQRDEEHQDPVGTRR